MSFSVALSITEDQVNVPEQVRALVTGSELQIVAGRAVRNKLVEHFVELGNERHRPDKQGPSFYGEVRRSVQQPEIEAGKATVSINHVGIAQRFFGGKIRPTGGKQWLPIPNPEIPGMAGRRAGEYEDLKFAPFGPELAALMSLGPLETRTYKNGKSREVHVGDPVVLFWLRKEVFQEPDETVLPDTQELLSVALAAAQKRVERIQTRQAGASES